MIYFIAKSNLVAYAFLWEKRKGMDCFSETTGVYDIKGPMSLRFTIFKLFSLETTRPIEAKFHVEPP